MLRPNAQKTLDALNLQLLDDILVDGQSGMPTVSRCDIVPSRMIPYSKIGRRTDLRGAVHFYVEDYKFTHFWTSPETHLPKLRMFDCVVAPDFSTYLDMPGPMVLWQIYRRRFLSQWLQKQGVEVIYNVQSLPAEYDDAQLCGIDPGGVVSMRVPLGYDRNPAGRNLFYRMISVVEARLQPSNLLIYGEKANLPTNSNLIIYKNDNYRVCKTES